MGADENLEQRADQTDDSASCNRAAQSDFESFLQSHPDDGDQRIRFRDVYAHCFREYAGDIAAMKDRYHKLVEQGSIARQAFDAMLKDITRLHRLECRYGIRTVRTWLFGEELPAF